MSQTQIFRGTARNIVRDNTVTKYYYHNTAIVEHEDSGLIRLNTGGWFTNTTKTAMNQASNQFGLGFKVFQKNHEWFVTWKGVDHKFKGDGINII